MLCVYTNVRNDDKQIKEGCIHGTKMAIFLNTSATNFYLEELIKDARERVILISPYLKLNDRIKELLEDKDRLKIDIRIIYGKSELQPAEIEWLRALTYVRTSFCKNLHAKCYLSEDICIITSLNLYEFSQVNNNEMGVLLRRSEDETMYSDAYDEAQRIIRISDEVKISVETIQGELQAEQTDVSADQQEMLSTSKLAKKLGTKSSALKNQLTELGFVLIDGDEMSLTEKGKTAGGQTKSGRYGVYVVWPSSLSI